MLTGQIYFKRATFLFSFPKKSNLQTDDKKITILPIKEVDLQHFPADVETEAMLYERAGRFVDYLKERYDGKQVLAVGHGLINRAVQAHIQGVTLEHLRSVPKMNNAELRRFKLT